MMENKHDCGCVIQTFGDWSLTMGIRLRIIFKKICREHKINLETWYYCSNCNMEFYYNLKKCSNCFCTEPMLKAQRLMV